MPSRKTVKEKIEVKLSLRFRSQCGLRFKWQKNEQSSQGRAVHRDTSTANLESVACLILVPHMLRTIFFSFSSIPYLPPNDVIYKKQACQSYSHISYLTFIKIDFYGRYYVILFHFIRYEINVWSTRNAFFFQSFCILWISHIAQKQLQG